MEEAKTCKDCGHEKAISEFCRYKDSPDGHWNRCKPCMKERDRQTRKRTKAKNAERDPYALVNGEVRYKTCTCCKRSLRVVHYSRSAGEPDGLNYACKDCIRIKTQNCRESNRERNLESGIPAIKICTKCGETKKSSQFYRDATKPDGLDNRCRRCSSAEDKARRELHKATYETRTEGTKLCSRCLFEKPVTAFTVLRSAKDGLRYHCKDCEAKEYQRLVEEVLRHYCGGKKPKCAYCGYEELGALTIDHPNDDGAAHRRAMKGVPIYRWLKRNNYPEGFVCACFNCNSRRERRQLMSRNS